jgi:hypothetical protein
LPDPSDTKRQIYLRGPEGEALDAGPDEVAELDDTARVQILARNQASTWCENLRKLRQKARTYNPVQLRGRVGELDAVLLLGVAAQYKPSGLTKKGRLC